MPFFVVARPHFSVACDICRVGAELCGRRAHGLEGAAPALARFAALGWTDDLPFDSSDAAEWVNGLGAARWRCAACSRRPFPSPDAPRLAIAPPGLLSFLCGDDGAVRWTHQGEGELRVAHASETGTGRAWQMAALPLADGWAALVSRRRIPHGYVTFDVRTGFASLDDAAAWARVTVEMDHWRIVEREAAVADASRTFLVGGK